jgi:hypothetical protein
MSLTALDIRTDFFRGMAACTMGAAAPPKKTKVRLPHE